MELRPRKGRSTQPPSTPSSVKPFPRTPAPFSSRKKPVVPASPIHVSSSDEEEERKELDNKKQGDGKGMIAAENHDFETPLPRQRRMRSSTRKVSEAKKIAKVTSATPALPLNPVNVAENCLDEVSTGNDSKDSIEVASEKPVLAKATTRNVSRVSNGVSSSEKSVSVEVLTENVSRVSNVIVAEATTGNASRVSHEVSSEKIAAVEVSRASSKGKKVQSSKKKGAKKMEETNRKLFEDGAGDHEVTDPKFDKIDDDQVRSADAFASAAHINDHKDTGFANEVQDSRSLVLPMQPKDDAAQALDAMEVDGRDREALTGNDSQVSNEMASGKLVQAEASRVSSKGKKAQSSKKATKKRDETNLKLFEDTYHGTVDYEDTEPEGQVRHANVGAIECKDANRVQESKRKGDGRDHGNVHHGDSEQRVNKSEEHGGRSLGGSFKESEAVEPKTQECDGDKLDRFHGGIGGEATINQSVRAEASCEKAAPRHISNEDISNDQDDTREDNHDAAKGYFEENVVLSDEGDSGDDDVDDDDDDDDNDNDDDDEEMAKLFVRSMQAHLQQTSEQSVVSIQKEMQAKQDGLDEEENHSEKAAVKGLQLVSGSSFRSTSFGLSWSPETGLPTSKSLNAQTRNPKCIMKPDTIWRKEGKLQDGLFVPPVDPLKLNKLARKQKDHTAGAKWFNLSAPIITPELKKELQLLKLRGVVDPKRHYKAEDSKGLPKYFQVGTVVGGPADFYSGRLTKKEQKSSLADELLSDSSLTAYRKRKYVEIQDQKQAGGKAFWKKKKSKRTPAWARI